MCCYYMCFIDLRQPYARIVDIVYGITMVIVFAVNAICYGAIYVKMQQTARQASSDNQNDKYHKAAKLMLLFVAVYLLQWWPYTTQALWSLVTPIPFGMVIIVVVVCNLGGLYNAIVYTIIRRRYTKVSGVENNSAMQTGNTNAD
ncbi:hypothetical protein CAPTEDRAFT_212404 [Capitella teleta]|uniref:G-protein coupled receptors family 1 profile domain-containing protein n=1 Tax=Capitella teleta TaxID=283909 RepID=R7TX66_CAPTE|nr:hypothetical protein CAPTEDRAFT_212404 [Capitella teleta]|eukprot:ELT98197.1 hypothetical protein CAPTEDRAFT_212404 [Capitella teleta]